jgi:hypothetical protein
MGTCTPHALRIVGATLVFLLSAALPAAPDTTRRGSVPVASARTGVLQLDYAEFQLTLLSAARKKVEVAGRNGKAIMPAGSYTLLSWTLGARGTDGRRWMARGGMGIDDLTITPGRTTTLRLASPLKARWRSATGTNPTLMELKFSGTSGEECLGVGVEGQGPPGPRFEVRDGNGTVVGGGTVRFCCKFRGAAIWRRDGTAGTPAGEAGRFTATVACDWGPFPVEMERPLTFDVGAVTAAESVATVGGPAIELSLPPVEGGTPVALAALRDRPVLLCFFCGCAPCCEVAEKIAAWDNVHLLAVVSDATSFQGEALRRFRALTGFKGSILLDRDRAIVARYGSFECPRVWLVDRAGRLAYVNESAREEPTRIVAALRAALDALKPADPVAAAR